jgi:hypothetical protein
LPLDSESVIIAKKRIYVQDFVTLPFFSQERKKTCLEFILTVVTDNDYDLSLRLLLNWAT